MAHKYLYIKLHLKLNFKTYCACLNGQFPYHILVSLELYVNKIVNFIFLVGIVSIGTITTSSAAPIALDIEWQNSSTAMARGFIIFDDSLLETRNSQGGFSLPRSAILDLGITISGASSGNGTFNLSDFESISFNSPSSLNFGAELIGQSLANGCFFGVFTTISCNDNLGDYTLFGATPTAPSAVFFFALATSGGLGDSFSVKSMKPVPLPSSLGLFGLGLAGMGFTRIKNFRWRLCIGL